MITIKCDRTKGGCGMAFEIDEDKCREERYMQCPYCYRQFPNPFYEEKF